MMKKMDKSKSSYNHQEVDSPAIRSRLNITKKGLTLGKKSHLTTNMNKRFNYSKNKMKYGISQYSGGYTKNLKSRLEKRHMHNRTEEISQILK